MAEEAKKLSSTVGAPFQLMFILLSSFFISYSIYWRINHYNQHDTPPSINVVAPKDIATYGRVPEIITTGLFIDQFQKFDLVGNEFIFTGVLWFKFNPGAISLDALHQVNLERGKIIERSKPMVKLSGDQLIVRYNVKGQFNNLLSFSSFPLDDHRISIALSNRFAAPSEMLFESSERHFVTQKNVSSVGWIEIDRKVTAGYAVEQLDNFDKNSYTEYPMVLFSVDYSRYSIRQVLLILTPLLLIFFLVLFSFSLEAPSIYIPLGTGGVTATLAYRFVIENLSPRVGYFMLGDYLFFLFLAGTFLVFITNIIEAFAFSLSIHLKKLIIVGLHLLVIGTGSLLILLWV